MFATATPVADLGGWVRKHTSPHAVSVARGLAQTLQDEPTHKLEPVADALRDALAVLSRALDTIGQEADAATPQ